MRCELTYSVTTDPAVECLTLAAMPRNRLKSYGALNRMVAGRRGSQFQ